jgi:hypothetical protein
MTATPARSGPNAARTFLLAKSRDPFMKLLEREAREKADREAAAHDLEQRESEAAFIKRA